MSALRRHVRGVCLAMTIGLCGLVARPAVADPAGARAHFEMARRYFQIDEYRKAIEEFKAAHLEEPDPAFLYNIAECHRRLGETKEALVFYGRFLSLSMPNAPSRATAEKRVAELKAAARDTSPASATAAGGEAPTRPPEPDHPVPHLALQAPPPSSSSSSPPPPEAVVSVAPALSPGTSTEESAAPPAVAASARPFYKSGWFYATLGGALVAGSLGVWMLSSGGDKSTPSTPLGNQRAF